MSRRSSPDQFIRGGQTTQHWLRMASQVFKTGTSFAALVFFVVYVGLCTQYFRWDYVPVTWAHWISSFAVESRGEPEREVRYRDPEQGWITRSAEEIYTDPFATAVSADYNAKALSFAWWSAIPAVLAFLLAFGVFYLSGRRLEGDEHIRGTHLVTAKELKRWTERKWKAYAKQFGKAFKTGPKYTIAGIKFPPNAVEAQTAICGTVGTGKSNAIKELLATVRDHGGRAIIYDRMGAYVRDFYDPTRDIIINPFDMRSHVWSPFLEAESPEFFTQIAEVLIPDTSSGGDAFWTKSARIVFDYAAQQIFGSKDASNARLRDAILNIPAEELSALIEQTPGRHFFNEDIKKTSGSIRANLISELRFLEFLRDDGDPFSIREWIKREGSGFVFLTGDAEHAAATRNVISTIFEVAANALMTCEEANDPRVWFIMDEVPTLNRMPFLPKSLAEIRQFGGAFVVGYQVYSQLEDIYGDKGAQTIAGNLNNRIVFNTPDADTAERFSKSLGSEDVEERRESITVGAHETRDGVGFMSQRTERRIVTASQIQSLPQFEGYVRFAYDAPTAFVRFEPFEVENDRNVKKFIPYGGRGMAEGSMETRSYAELSAAGCAPDNVPFKVLPPETRAQEYQAWRRRMLSAPVFHMTLPEREEQLDWKFFALRRTEGQRPGDIGPPPPFYGRMMDGSGFEFPEGFDPGPLPGTEAAYIVDEVEPQPLSDEQALTLANGEEAPECATSVVNGQEPSVTAPSTEIADTKTPHNISNEADQQAEARTPPTHPGRRSPPKPKAKVGKETSLVGLDDEFQDDRS